MRSRFPTTNGLLALGCTTLCAAALSAQSLSRLPAGLALPRSADSPGQVTFLHETHVDPDRPDCTTCHPRLFSILKQDESARRVPIVHAQMEKGGQCGACHDGKRASAIEDDCTHCHRE
jgi:c(7)-type cytochrome triheme protein